MTAYLNKIKKLQLEISNFCNATCIGCRRSDPETLTPRYDLANSDPTFINLDIIKKIIDDPLFLEIEEIEFCGTIDEPLAHPQFIEILDLFSDERTDLFVRIHTNAAIRNEYFYIDLAEALIKFDKHEVRFSIDGLEESHKIYRGDLDYKKIMKHAETFINYGGHAVWQMLQFPWNENEVEDCRTLAQEMKFKKIVVRRDRTFSSTLSVVDIKRLRQEKTPSKHRERTLDFKMPHERDEDITCHYQNEGMIFMNYQGRIFPCCFIANLDLVNFSQRSIQFFDEIYGKYGNEFNNLHEHSLTDIMNSIWYQKTLTASWSSMFGNIENPKLLVCSISCGKKSAPKANHISQENLNV